jgi:hypothetical protein
MRWVRQSPPEELAKRLELWWDGRLHVRGPRFWRRALDRRFVRGLAGSRYAEVVQAGRAETAAPGRPTPPSLAMPLHGHDLDRAA